MTWEERTYAVWVVSNRMWHGGDRIILDGHLTAQAQLQASRMASSGILCHSPTGELGWWLGRGWAEIGENVAYGPTPLDAHEAIVYSPAHLTNQLNPAHAAFGVAIRRGHGRVWVAEVYGGLP